MSRGCYEEIASVEFQLIAAARSVERYQMKLIILHCSALRVNTVECLSFSDLIACLLTFILTRRLNTRLN